MIVILNPVITINISDVQLSQLEKDIYTRMIYSKHKFYLIGSRYLGNSTAESDMDFLTSSEKAPLSVGLEKVSLVLRRCEVKSIWRSSGPDPKIDVWVTKNPQYEAEKMFSFCFYRRIPFPIGRTLS